jgi:O-acetyl-ADP-ribose deacetylase (regulator of RNase III)
MPIQFVAGDLFANRFGARALAHGCNCQGSMGAGIATGFRDRYPEMYTEYRRLCKAQPRQFNPGDAWLWKAEGQPWVFNLATQEGTCDRRGNAPREGEGRLRSPAAAGVRSARLATADHAAVAQWPACTPVRLPEATTGPKLEASPGRGPAPGRRHLA